MQTQRHSLLGLPDISRNDTLEILNSFKDKERKHLLREIAGAFQTGQQKKHWNDTGNSTCAFCPCEDSKKHRLVECAAFSENRQPFLDTLNFLTSEDHSMLDFPVIHARKKRMCINSFNFKNLGLCFHHPWLTLCVSLVL